ncbi:MAG: flavodoxin family protein, partial [Synergistaceae bacterium]|nr:flavodoxin family protein [Synergistaceae bacterium]
MSAIKKVHLVYFSPSGSSEKVLKKIASAISKDIPVETHDLLTPASRKKEYNFGSGDLVFFCTMTASLVLTKFDEIFGCLNGNGAPFVGVVTFANTLYMKVILLEEIKKYAEKRGFKVAALGA